jgi:predicted RNase H-like HicB family nuclease
MEEKTFLVAVRWDPEAGVFVAESDDVPGLITEAESREALVAKLRVMIPELLELNGAPLSDSYSVEISYTTIEKLRVHV